MTGASSQTFQAAHWHAIALSVALPTRLLTYAAMMGLPEPVSAAVSQSSVPGFPSVRSTAGPVRERTQSAV